ncbi:MAG: nucleoside hydrolase [Treponema sp.]|jgi:inosine-uridine nucleoside N-ribohydrolase|nr:nucleoside hydrolase [Treponema sp.]
MSQKDFVHVDRLVPEIPPVDKRIKLIIDTDVGNEIDDFYAIALVLASPDRFDLKGICGANYNNNRPGGGPDSIRTSVELTHDLLKAAGLDGKFPVLQGSHPLQYYGFPSESEGARFIVGEAKKASPDDPLWVVILGASSTAASALLMDPTIVDNIRYVYHTRSEYTWPQRSVQFNVKGDIHAARSILASRVPLVWFDTGTHLTIPYDLTKKYLAPINALGKFLHDFRDRDPYFSTDDKGFFDMGDFVFLIDPSTCKWEVTYAPRMDEYMFFDFSRANGKMLRVFDIDNDRSWNLLFQRLRKMYENNDRQ